VVEGDRYCEACGHDQTLPAPDRSTLVPPRWLSSSAEAGQACPGCGGTEFGSEGYCESCGQRRPTSAGHNELELTGVAGVTDLGRRHHRNEDAMGIGELPGVVFTVICDGVSSSSRADTASHAAVDAASPVLLAALTRGTSPEEALAGAVRAAQAAATRAAGPEPGSNPPSSTFVGAVVTAAAVTVGWVGDSRAYWLPEDRAEAACLTSDDSLAGQLAVAGVEVPLSAQSAQATALVRWLGADSTDSAAHLRTFTPQGPGRVLVCSDGLFRYRPGAAELAALAPGLPPLAAASSLVQFALGEGGQDNVSVVLLPFPPFTSGGEPS
jgi:serine/threonine protein phosphatase PrpC